jgi:hypothetical protein
VGRCVLFLDFRDIELWVFSLESANSTTRAGQITSGECLQNRPAKQALLTPIPHRNLSPADRCHRIAPHWVGRTTWNSNSEVARTDCSGSRRSSEQGRGMAAVTVLVVAASLLLGAKLFPQEAVTDCVIHLVQKFNGL